MKLQTAYLAYLDLTPNLNNRYSDATHQIIIKNLRKNFFSWNYFFEKYGKEYSMGFYINTKKGTETLTILGPSVSRKMKIVDYSIFLPDEINDLNHYIDLVFEGIGIVLAKFNVPIEDVEKMKVECKKEIGI